ncbi:DUF1499 domain-containing protein [Shimia litoralis]|uniref:DUF1499 domain-containing protein n=1 Tax=Shimia litoralis TaxID=420403 RepID=A0A4U7N4K5_9RHOB|nr:DUF1499 domain-containing protein [Shimia litoralis]TKZ20722.1 DUF1499 domain-containing protein [Shimia litoralis]
MSKGLVVKKGFGMIVLWVLAFVCLAFLAYVRLAPSDPTVWHVAPSSHDDKSFSNGVIRQVPSGQDGLRRMDIIVSSDPRTQKLAGDVASGMITYVSRSRMVGFPDYTTMVQSGEDLVIYARSRFGRKDFGVNAARVNRWVDALTAY